jgi:hypothetical protein
MIGLSWGSLGAAVLMALLVGAFLGNAFASHRMQQRARLSVWAVLERRLQEERAKPPKPDSTSREGAE